MGRKKKTKEEQKLVPQKILKYYNKIATAKGFVADVKLGGVSNVETPAFKRALWILDCPHCHNELVMYEIKKEEIQYKMEEE